MQRLHAKLLTDLKRLICRKALEHIGKRHFQVNKIRNNKTFYFDYDDEIHIKDRIRLLCSRVFYGSKEFWTENEGFYFRFLKKKIFSSLGLPLILSSSFIVQYRDAASKELKLLEEALNGNLNGVKRLLTEGVNVNCRHPLGWTALHVAAANGHLDVVEALLKAGADPDLGDNFSSANEVAIEKNLNFIDVSSRRQKEFSKRINALADCQGFTALHYAVLFNDIDIIKALMEAEADPRKEDRGKHSPIDYCKKEIKPLLLDYSAKYEAISKRKRAEERRRFPLEKKLKQFLVGQKGAIAVVAAAIRRKENGWMDDEHPLVFLFLGSSGIGKTELAKQVARYLHKDKANAFIRFDMSEYQEKHEVAKLIGSPPGYIGYTDGGQLTTRLKKFPNAVVLFDEVDKAHPDVLTVLLQLFDEGRLTDGKGETIICRDAIFVMTSNLGSDEISQHALQLREEAENLYVHRYENKISKMSKEEDVNEMEEIKLSRNFKEKVVQPILKRHFKRDEFLGRINEIVYFLPFSKSELLQLVTMELEFWAKMAREKHGIELTWDQDVPTALANGYDVHYGARSIKYEIERRIVTQLALGHEQGIVTPGCSIQIKAVWPEKDIKRETSPLINLKIKQKGQKDFVDIDYLDNLARGNNLF